VEKVLQIATLDKKYFKFKPEQLDVHQLIEQAMANVALAVEKKSGQIHLQLNAASPQVYTDKLHLTNVINNLLDNANKYSPQQPEITIRTEQAEDGIILQIKDNGIGMAREELHRIFEKFYRVPTGNLHDVKGFGLGLTYVKTILEALGGNISVSSSPKKGSTFVIYIPANHEF
ncbi:MAG: sensor histidine kinase, partial [Cyclobacteriaceae bacterium]